MPQLMSAASPARPRWIRSIRVSAFLAALLTLPAGVPATTPVRDLPPVSVAHGVPADLLPLYRDQGLHLPAAHLASRTARMAQGSHEQLRVAVLLVQFPGEPADQLAHSRAYYERLFFSHGELPGGSITEFYEASSNGRLSLVGEVRGWYTLSQPRSYYAAGAAGIGIFYPRNSQGLAEEAVRLANPHINFAHFDDEGPDGVADSGDDDELIDALVVVHQGGGSETAGRDQLASVAWVTASRIPVDGVFALPFALTPENGEIGVFIHELGHLLGLPDLYDTDGGSLGLGYWSMMASGSALDGGRTPSDFDAWSKVRLGFVDVVTLTQNRRDFLMPPVLESGTVYRMFRGGGGSTEYFLMENRQASGIDRALPGSGLLIYHVDDRVANNNTPSRYKVALEQADGLYQLERRFDSGSHGDAGDPFQPGDNFSRYSDPSSLDYAGQDSHVSVYNIRAGGDPGSLIANIAVEPSAILDVVELELQELEGDGDGLLQAGELAGVRPHLSVSQAAAVNLTLGVSSDDPLALVLTPEFNLGTVTPGSTHAPAELIQVRIGQALPTDPYALALDLNLEWDNAAPRRIRAALGLGTVVGSSEDFESPQHGWTTEVIRASANNQWLYGPHFGTDNSAGFKSGNFNKGFRRGGDAALVSPAVLLPPSAELIFDHLVDILSVDSTTVLAGGVVEISVNGSDWIRVKPRAGYNAFSGATNPEWTGKPVFSLSPSRGAFQTDRVDLSAYAGMVRVRFRFFSETESSFGKGWWIDNVRIESVPTPVNLVTVDVLASGNDVLLRWELAEPLPQRVRWIRGSTPEDATPVSPGWIPAATRGQIVDLSPQEPLRYWIEGMERDGRLERWGPWEPGAATAPALAWTVTGNPGAGSVHFAFSGTLPEGSALQVFDVQGRLVHTAALEPGAGQALWHGESATGGLVSPGVYFARVQGASLTPVRIVRLP